MSAADTAEAFLIVLKRLGKWVLWFISGLILLSLLVFVAIQAKGYWENRPHKAMKFAEVTLGDSEREVRYLLGPPTEFIDPRPAPKDSNPFSQFDSRVISTMNNKESVSFEDSSEWMYSEGDRRIDVGFDRPKGQVVSVACYSESPLLCPPLFGIRGGTTEEEVLSHLGAPTASRIDGVTKILTYSQYNLTLFLMKKRVYFMRISEGAKV